MASVLDTQDSTFYVTSKSVLPKGSHLVIATEKGITPGSHIIGICISNQHCSIGTNLTLHGVADTVIKEFDSNASEGDDIGFYAKECDTFTAVDGNILGIAMGKTFNIRFRGKPNLGYMFGTNAGLVAISIDVQEEEQQQERCTHERKKIRSVLQRVQIDTGKDIKVLNVENTMRCIVAWLEHMNKLHAHKFSLDKLVWCEEGTSARSEKGMVRGWFKNDTQDKRRKIVANATDAIACMEQELAQLVPGVNFYNEMKTNFAAYNVDLVENGPSANKPEQPTVVVLPMPVQM